MMVFDLFKRSSTRFLRTPVKDQARNLLAAAMQAARDPGMYGPGRVPDSFAGRFEAVTLTASLVSARLTAIGDEARPLNQAFVDALFKSFDDALREDGVGDLTVPKKMQKIAEAFYGRAAAYRTAFEQIETGEAQGPAALEDAELELVRIVQVAPLVVFAIPDDVLLQRILLQRLGGIRTQDTRCDMALNAAGLQCHVLDA